MTVKELIAELSRHDPEMHVAVMGTMREYGPDGELHDQTDFTTGIRRVRQVSNYLAVEIIDV